MLLLAEKRAREVINCEDDIADAQAKLEELAAQDRASLLVRSGME